MYASFNFYGILEKVSESIVDEGFEVILKFSVDNPSREIPVKKFSSRKVFKDTDGAYNFVSWLALGFRYRVYATVEFDSDENGTLSFQDACGISVKNIIRADEGQKVSFKPEVQEFSKEEFLPVSRGGIMKKAFCDEFERRMKMGEEKDVQVSYREKKKSGIALSFAVLAAIAFVITALLHG